MEIKAKARYIKMSSKKIRLIIDVVRGMDASSALSQLKFINKLATKPVEKLLNSAIANAVHNFDLDKDNLYIKEIRADEGPTVKRWRPRAFGRAGAIRKRSSHISIILSERVESKKKHDGKREKLEKPKTVKDIEGKIIEKDEKPKKPTNDKPSKDSSVDGEKEVFDEKSKGKHRHKGHLDKLKEKESGGIAKRMFRRKSG